MQASKRSMSTSLRPHTNTSSSSHENRRRCSMGTTDARPRRMASTFKTNKRTRSSEPIDKKPGEKPGALLVLLQIHGQDSTDNVKADRTAPKRSLKLSPSLLSTAVACRTTTSSFSAFLFNQGSRRHSFCGNFLIAVREKKRKKSS